MKEENNLEMTEAVEETEKREIVFIETAKIWFEKHRNFLRISRGVALTTALIYLLKQMGTSEEELAVIVEPFHDNGLAEQIKPLEIKRTYTIPQEPVYTRMHSRTLPLGQHASQKKLDEAASLGIVLAENQTLVDSYPRYN